MIHDIQNTFTVGDMLFDRVDVLQTQLLQLLNVCSIFINHNQVTYTVDVRLESVVQNQLGNNLIDFFLIKFEEIGESFHAEGLGLLGSHENIGLHC